MGSWVSDQGMSLYLLHWKAILQHWVPGEYFNFNGKSFMHFWASILTPTYIKASPNPTNILCLININWWWKNLKYFLHKNCPNICKLLIPAIQKLYFFFGYTTGIRDLSSTRWTCTPTSGNLRVSPLDHRELLSTFCLCCSKKRGSAVFD